MDERYKVIKVIMRREKSKWSMNICKNALLY